MEHFGSQLTRQELDFIGLRIDAQHREDAPELMRSRWFEYWALHPVAATYLYAARYKDQVRQFTEAFIDADEVDDARAFVPDDIFKSRDMTGMWLARCAADRCGVPYEIALGFAQRRAVDRIFQRFPRPNQLYGEEFELDLADYWKELCRASMQYSRDPHYSASAWHGKPRPPEVEAHIQHLIAQVHARPEPHTGLLARMFREDRLHPAWTLPFAPAQIEAAAQDSKSTLTDSL